MFPNANYARWSGTPSIVARGSSVTFTGVIVADPTVYVTQADREQLLDKCRDNVSRALSSQVDRFLSDYPNVQKARIEIELTLK